MNTDKQQIKDTEQGKGAGKPTPRIRVLTVRHDNDNGIKNLVNIMSSVSTDTSEAKLNETSISDGKGGRIELDFDDIKKK